MADRSFQNTKIVATLGPASDSYETMVELVKAGVDVFRINMSHGSHEVAARQIETISKLIRTIKSMSASLQIFKALNYVSGR